MPTEIILNRVASHPAWSAQIAVGASGLPAAFRSFDFPDASEWPLLLNALAGGDVPFDRMDVLKESAHGRVWRVRRELPCKPQTVIIRSWPRRPSIVRGLRSMLRADPARLHWRKSMRLINSGIHTALPLVFCQWRRGPDAAWLITTEVADAMDLDTIVLAELPRLDRAAALPAKRRLVVSIVDVLVRLRRGGIHHRDLKASNLLVTDWAHNPTVWIVDVEGVRLFGRRRQWSPIVRLASSLLSYRSVTRTDYVRFLRAYLSRIGPDHEAWRDPFDTLGREAARYARSAQRRKRHKLDGFGGD